MMRQIAAIPRALNPLRLTGPILDKELRVSSRRRRNYVLRSMYLAILLLVVVMIWVEEVDTRYANVTYRASRLAGAGLLITAIVIGCQFYIAQLLAAIMLSNSISDEIYNKTLGSLMSTPINSFQIVVGKLLGKLLQLILLMCVTLPILAIVRVFGGVPWDFLIRSLCVTMTAIIFAGLLSLNISIHSKHAYSVIITSVLGLAFLYVLLPLVCGWVASEYFDVSEDVIWQWVSVTNPLMCMQVLLMEMTGARGIPFSGSVWWVHCLLMLACSTALFLRAVIVVRKKALRQACGQLDGGRVKIFARKVRKEGRIRHVIGKPLIWKELRRPALKMGPVKKTIVLLLFLGGLGVSYYIFGIEEALYEGYCHILYVMIFAILGIFSTTVLAATTITSEKQSRSWPALLSTLVSERDIICGKILGVFKKGLFVWTLLFAHLLVFASIGFIHPAAIFLVLLILIPVFFVVTSAGIFFSNVFKHTTSAVIANLGFCAFLYAGIPFLAVFLCILAHDDGPIDLVGSVHPLYHLVMVLVETTGRNAAHTPLSAMDFEWPNGNPGFATTTTILIMIGFGYLVLSGTFLATAANSLRRKVF